MITRLLFIGFLICCISFSFGQQLPDKAPQTPEAAALSKYSEYPVGTFTGVPSINVPLYTISSGDISLPIGLNYHAGGFRVSEEASWVGLGWTLTANGVITRTVNGYDDFTGSSANGGTPNFYHNPLTPDIVDISSSGSVYPNSPYIVAYADFPNIMPEFASTGNNGFNIATSNTFSYSRFRSSTATVNGNLVNYSSYNGASFDWEPDVYSMNFMGYNGKFVMDQDKNVHFLEKMDVDVSYDGTKWIVKTNDGFKYYFESKETTTNYFNIEQNGTWYLTKIISANQKVMTFTYENAPSDYWQYTFSESASIFGGDYGVPQSFYSVPVLSQIKFRPKYLSRIDFDEGYVLFSRDANLREDLKGGERLKSIKIYDKNNVQIKEFEFVTGYFNSNSPVRGYLNLHNLSTQDYDYYKKRLKLDKVIEKNGSLSKEHLFNYNTTTNLPNKDSYNQDHWGYPNAASGGNTLMPTFKGMLTFKNRWRQSQDGNLDCWFIHDPWDNSVYSHRNGNNRETNVTYMNANMLKEIVYPTRGKTSFEFEANEYSNLAEVGEGYTYETFNKTARIIGFANQADIIDNAVSVSLPSDVVDIIYPRVTLFTEFSGSPIYVPNMTATLSTNGFNQTYNFNSKIYLENSYNYVEDLSGVTGGPITWSLSSPGELYADKTFYAQFSCIIKRQNPPSKKLAGGLRVKKITHYDPVSQDEVVKAYEYGYSNVSYGKLKVPIKYYHLNWDNQACSSYFQFSSSNNFGLSPTQSSHIGYSKVIEKLGLNGESGKNEYEYHNTTNTYYTGDERPPGVPNSFSALYDGKLSKKSVFNSLNQKVQEETSTYTWLSQNIVKGIYQDRYIEPFFYMGLSSLMYGNGGLHYYPIFSRWEILASQTSRTYDLAGNLNTENYTTYEYNAENLLPSLITTLDSKGNTLKTKNYYANDVVNVNSLGETLDPTTEYPPLISLKKTDQYKTSIPIQVETYKNTVLLSRQRTNFWTWSGITLPKNVKMAKGTGSLQERVVYNGYDDKGNPVEVSMTDGTSICYIWGYDKQYPIAKIENATFVAGRPNTITGGQQTLINDAISASALTTETTTGSENNLRAKLQLLREGFSGAMITTYTYDPLIGVTSMTDPKGYTVYYEYDDLNRLKLVRDAAGKLLSTNKYHYKDQ